MKDEWIRQLKRNAGVLTMLVNELSEDQLNTPLGKSNTILWILGHMANSRGSMLKYLGQDISEREWEASVCRGAVKKAVHLDINEVMQLFRERGERVISLLPDVTDDYLDTSLEKKLPDGSNDIRGTVSFLLFHEAFHLGQIDLILAGLGIGGIA